MGQSFGDIVDRQRARVCDWFWVGLSVVGRGREAEMDVCDVSLRELVGKVGEACRGFEEYGQHASRQRIERSSVAHAMRAGQVTEAPDDLEGRLTSGFVDVEDASYETRMLRASLRRHRSPPLPPSAPNAPPLPSASRSRPLRR